MNPNNKSTGITTSKTSTTGTSQNFLTIPRPNTAQKTSPTPNTQSQELTQAQVLQNLQNFSNTTGSTAISPEALESVKSVTLPSVQTPTAPVSNILATTGSMSESQRLLNQQANQAQQARDQQRQSLIDLQNEIVGIQSGSEQARQEAGIDVKAQRVNELTTRLESLQRSEQNQIRALEGTSLTDAQKNARIAEIQRQSAFEQADVALLQSAANRDLATAESILQNKTQLKLQPLQTRLEFAKLFYDENKAEFTKAEDRAYQNMIKEDERQYQDEVRIESFKNDIIKQAIKDGNTALIASVGGSETIQGIANAMSQNIGQSVSAETLDAYSLANDILNSNFGAITGFQFGGVPGTRAAYIVNQYEQLKGFLSLENREKLKGSGAISDFESKVLQQAASALGRNLSNKDFEKELKKIKGVLGTASGIPANVRITDPLTNKSKIGTLDRNGINSAISQGYIVTYE